MERRKFIKQTASVASAAIVMPTIVPSSVLGKNAPSNKINIGQIGCGRIARSHDMAETLKYDQARLIAVCDVDRNRVIDAKKLVETYYAKNTDKKKEVDVKMYEDYKEMLANPDIDAVQISTPDHWHSQRAIELFRIRHR